MTGAEEPDALDLVFTTPGLSATEVAAVTAVLSAAIAEQATERELRGPAQSAWERSARRLRSPIHVVPGAWHSFSAGGY